MAGHRAVDAVGDLALDARAWGSPRRAELTSGGRCPMRAPLGEYPRSRILSGYREAERTLSEPIKSRRRAGCGLRRKAQGAHLAMMAVCWFRFSERISPARRSAAEAQIEARTGAGHQADRQAEPGIEGRATQTRSVRPRGDMQVTADIRAGLAPAQLRRGVGQFNRSKRPGGAGGHERERERERREREREREGVAGAAEGKMSQAEAAISVWIQKGEETGRERRLSWR